ncbi:MAG: FAD-dependent oxidoreductase [Gemmatimonadaceae bacterium]
MSDDHELSRRNFLRLLVAAPLVNIAIPSPAGVGTLASATNRSAALVGLSRKTNRLITGGFVEDDSTVGHQLRDGKSFAAAREQRRVSVAIVGGGMGGLSAGWRLDALNMRDWVVLELGAEPGGNSRGGENEISRYPWGAHYVPVPGKSATHVRQMFREFGLLDADGTWDERTLCHSPQERLWQHGHWHDGLEPDDGATKLDRDEFARFTSIVNEWRASNAFKIPMGDVQLKQLPDKLRASLNNLDTQNAAGWFVSQGFKSPALKWWLEYGTRDDYGASLQQSSAWAAVHYFAARESEEQGPLTWPDGNNWIVRQLATRAGNRIITNAPAYNIERRGTKWLVRTPKMDVTCDVVIWAAPLLVLPTVVPTVRVPVETEYAPWVVANLTLEHWPFERGASPSWDNVIYDSGSLGYVVATHQFLGEPGPRSVWTWYHSVVDRSANDGRIMLRDKPWSAWRDFILDDLSRAHPNIRDVVSRVDVRRWGHAMARPVPGVLARMQTLRDWQPAPHMFVAHADMTGFSIFEEANWHGVTAAERAVRVLRG